VDLQTSEKEPKKINLRLIAGILFFILSLILPLFGFLVALTNLPNYIKAIIIGFLAVGGPEISCILAVIILGKENFNEIKEKIFSFLRKLQPSGSVSRTRYYLGLILFFVPIIPSYIIAYAPRWLPDDSPVRLWINISSDLIFIISLFILGGDFWDKLKALFVYDAKADFSGVSSAKTENIH
jgi:hypothetical protein